MYIDIISKHFGVFSFTIAIGVLKYVPQPPGEETKD